MYSEVTIPALRDMVQRIQRIIPGATANAVIAGGAVRDAILGGPVRDIDLYVTSSRSAELEAQFWPNLADRPITAIYQQGDIEYDHQSIEACREAITTSAYWLQQFPFLTEKPINLVTLKEHAEPGDVCSYFNLGTSQCLVSPDWPDPVRWPQFIQDVARKQCTVLRLDWGEVYTQKTIEKLLTKYPDFEVVLPNGDLFDWKAWDVPDDLEL